MFGCSRRDRHTTTREISRNWRCRGGGPRAADGERAKKGLGTVAQAGSGPRMPAAGPASGDSTGADCVTRRVISAARKKRESMRGRPPKPTALKLLAGNPGRRKLAPETVAAKLEPKPPKWLGPDGAALWVRLSLQLDAAGICRQTDYLAMEMLCRTYEAWRENERLLAEAGAISDVKNKDGEVVGMVRSPYCLEADRLFGELERLTARFGLTPADRARVSGGSVSETDSLMAFLKAG